MRGEVERKEVFLVNIEINHQEVLSITYISFTQSS